MRTSIISLLLSGLCACSQAPREAPSATIAFVDVNVVPMDEEHVLSHQTVIVEAGRITHIGAADQTELPEDAQVIDGTDSYLMPGLADMHVHASKEDFLLYVAAGVTTMQESFMQIDQGHFDELRKQPAMRYVSPEIMAWWTDFAQGSSHPPPSHNAEQGANHGKQGNAGGGFYSFQVRLVKGLHEAGVPILAGTDTPNPAMVPGFSLHEELRNLVQAGLTPYEALAAATRDAATFLQASDEWGTIAVGKRADLILLAANPLENVTHTTNRLGVMVNGQWFSQAQLQRMLDAYASSLAETPQ